MAGKAGGVANVVRRVVNDLDVRETHAPNQEPSEQSCKDGTDKRVASGCASRPGDLSKTDNSRLHEHLPGRVANAGSSFLYLIEAEVR